MHLPQPRSRTSSCSPLQQDQLAESFAPSAEVAKLGERRLGTIHAVAQALALGPMFSVALVLGSVSRPDIGAGWNATLAVLIAGLGVLAIGYVLSLFARRYAGAGAIYEYLARGVAPSVGIFTAGVFFLGTLFLGGGSIYLGFGILARGFWLSHISSASAPSFWLCGALALAMVLALNYLGLRVAIRVMLTFAVLSFVPMLLLAIIVMIKGGSDGNSLSVFSLGETPFFGGSGGSVLGGVLLGILLFVGFEAAASVGEESHDPHRSIPAAVMATIAVAATFFVIMAYAFSIGYGKAQVTKGAWASSPSPVEDMATRYVGSRFATALDLMVLLDALGLALAICVTIGRGFFALARDGLLPKVFTRLSRYDTPWVGNLMVGVSGIGLMLLVKAGGYGSRFMSLGSDGRPVALFPSDEFATFLLVATVGSFAVELVYLILALGAFRLLARERGKPWQYLVVTVAALTPVLGFYGALRPAPHDRSNYNWEALYWLIGLLALSLLWFVIVRFLRPQAVARAASHAIERQWPCSS